MKDWLVRMGVTAAMSIGAHALVVQLVELLPEEDASAADQRVVVSIVEPPKPPPVVEDPPPEPPKPDEPKPLPEPPKPIPTKTPPPKPPTDVPPPPKDIPPPKDSPPPDPNAKPTDTGDSPVFGVSMESTSQGGAGPAVQVGNTLSRGTQGGVKKPDDKAPPPGTGSGTAPVAAYEVTKMPLPRGSCAGKYTDEAKAAGTEGVVVLDLVVDAKGRATEVTVVSGLEHGLTEAAVAALKACTFTPGEKNGVAVPVKVRGFKIRFVMDQGQ
jgi:protein TonB